MAPSSSLLEESLGNEENVSKNIILVQYFYGVLKIQYTIISFLSTTTVANGGFSQAHAIKIIHKE